jgi:hypothetical protein
VNPFHPHLTSPKMGRGSFSPPILGGAGGGFPGEMDSMPPSDSAAIQKLLTRKKHLIG